ncbi:unnamed protein product [Trichogramma brassicae]|uniref:ATP-dependent DNA helicase RecQ zinc-binding domain-containing protein n=1 Tax=Trichogramma brassicae TaxID=86971 RepID=A0A6H5I7E1_9HYME|nr:unnamed protein product [Trichogramma brassicae]
MSADGELDQSVSQALAALRLENVSINNAINIIRGSVASSSDRSVAMSCIANKLSMGDGMPNMRDRLARFEIRARYGPESAAWDVNRDEIPAEVLGQDEKVIGGSQMGGSATPLASSPGNLAGNLRQWRLTDRAETSDSNSVSNSELNSSGGAIRRNGRIRSVSEPRMMEPSAVVLRRGQAEEQSEPWDLSINGGSSPDRIPEDRGRPMRGRLEEESRRIDLERNSRIERDRGRKGQETREEVCRRRAASTARRVAFASGVSGANTQNSANQVTFAGLDRSLPAAFVTARSEPSQSVMTGRSHQMQREIGQGLRASGNALSGVDGENLSERAWMSNRARDRLDRVPSSTIRRDVRTQDRRERTFVYENEASEADEMRGRSYSAGAYASRDYAPYSANRADLPSTRRKSNGPHLARIGTGYTCRHDLIMRHFDDSGEDLICDRNCDNCIRMTNDDNRNVTLERGFEILINFITECNEDPECEGISLTRAVMYLTAEKCRTTPPSVIRCANYGKLIMCNKAQVAQLIQQAICRRLITFTVNDEAIDSDYGEHIFLKPMATETDVAASQVRVSVHDPKVESNVLIDYLRNRIQKYCWREFAKWNITNNIPLNLAAEMWRYHAIAERQPITNEMAASIIGCTEVDLPPEITKAVKIVDFFNKLATVSCTTSFVQRTSINVNVITGSISGRRFAKRSLSIGRGVPGKRNY